LYNILGDERRKFGFRCIRNVMTYQSMSTQQTDGILSKLNLTSVPTTYINTPSYTDIYRLQPAFYIYYGRKNRVTTFLNGQFIIVYTCKSDMNHKYSLVIITPRIFSVLKCCISADVKDRDSWLNLYDQPLRPYGNHPYDSYFSLESSFA
jgi:hypothetical protein